MTKSAEIMMSDTIWTEDLNRDQLKTIMAIMKTKHGLCRVIIKDSVFNILSKKYPNDTIDNSIKSYAGTKCLVYNVNNIDNETGWYMLNDCLVMLTSDCFEVVSWVN